MDPFWALYEFSGSWIPSAEFWDLFQSGELHREPPLAIGNTAVLSGQVLQTGHHAFFGEMLPLYRDVPKVDKAGRPGVRIPDGGKQEGIGFPGVKSAPVQVVPVEPFAAVVLGDPQCHRRRGGGSRLGHPDQEQARMPVPLSSSGGAGQAPLRPIGPRGKGPCELLGGGSNALVRQASLGGVLCRWYGCLVRLVSLSSLSEIAGALPRGLHSSIASSSCHLQPALVLSMWILPLAKTISLVFRRSKPDGFGRRLETAMELNTRQREIQEHYSQARKQCPGDTPHSLRFDFVRIGDSSRYGS